MKSNFLVAALSVFLMVGCAAGSKTHKPVPTPAPTLPPLPAVSVVAPTPTAPATPNVPEVEVESEDDGPQLTPDGKRVLLKGEGWELTVPLNEGWRPLPSDPYTFVMMNPRKEILVIFDKNDWDKSLAELTKKHIAETKSADGNVVLQRSVTVNKVKGTYLEGKLPKRKLIVSEWLFVNKKSSYVFACAGHEEDFKETKPVCDELLEHLYLDTSAAK